MGFDLNIEILLIIWSGHILLYFTIRCYVSKFTEIKIKFGLILIILFQFIFVEHLFKILEKKSDLKTSNQKSHLTNTKIKKLESSQKPHFHLSASITRAFSRLGSKICDKYRAGSRETVCHDCGDGGSLNVRFPPKCGSFLDPGIRRTGTAG